VPPVDVTIRDVAHGGHAFAEVGAAVERKHQGPDAERLPHRVVAQEGPQLSSLVSSGWCGLLRGRRCQGRAPNEGGRAETASAHGAAPRKPSLVESPWLLAGQALAPFVLGAAPSSPRGALTSIDC
jgi:hypothetical protein